MTCPEMIRISINNKIVEIKYNSSISDLLKLAGYPQNVAVFVNNKQLMMKDYLTYSIKDTDHITVFRPLGGG
ncbi:MAG: sulfur carrier protein ThiS [Eubacteriales bacterium]|nr:sulfur carrier protein ThiS [Eubacteriales bacterium]